MIRGTYIVHFEDKSLKTLTIKETGPIFDDLPIKMRGMTAQAVQADQEMVYILLRDNSKQQFLCVNDFKLVENSKI